MTLIARDASATLARFRRRSLSGVLASTWGVTFFLLGVAALSILVRIHLASRLNAPTVFGDELGYTKLAQSIGHSGRMALFDNPGLSYSPLYSLVISPIYAFGASPTSAYSVAKIVNAFLMTLAILPTYKIARFVLPRSLSAGVAAISLLAPLMSYSVFTISENVAYPACLLSLWAMIAAVRTPSVKADAILLGSIFLATTARVQLIVLLPVALTALLLAAILGRRPDERLRGSLARAVRQHSLVFILTGVGVLAAGAGAIGRYDALSVLGRYSVVGRSGWPDPWHFLNVLIQHLAGLVIAVQIVPFVGTLVAAIVFVRARSRLKDHVAFAAVSASAAMWLLLEVSFNAAVFDHVGGGDVPRIHERLLIYLVPLFLVGLFAAYRVARRTASPRVFLVAACVTALLPLAIPFGTVVNFTVTYDSPGFNPFAQVVSSYLVPRPHATVEAFWIAATMSFVYVYVRTRLRAIVVLMLFLFIFVSTSALTRIEGVSNQDRSVLPEHVGWVDRAKPAGDVILVASQDPATQELETAYFNSSIKRVYTICRGTFGPEFGEKRLTVDRSGRMRGPSGRVAAPYVVGRVGLGLRGRVVARNRPGHEVLVAPQDGQVRVAAGTRPAPECTGRRRR
jgi:hypothetical protein